MRCGCGCLESTNPSANKRGYIDALFVILIWSGFILVSRLGGKSVLLPYDVVALRFGTAAIVLAPFWFFRRRINLLDQRMIFLALTGGVGYAVLAYLGFKYAPAAHAGILLPGTLPFGTALFSFIILKEIPSRWRAAGLTSIALGVACLLAGTFHTTPDYLLGDAVFVIASACWAVCSVYVRKWQIDAWDVTIGSALITAILYVPVYVLWLPKNIATAPWSMIGLQAFYQGIMAVIVAMALYMRAVKWLGPSKIGVCMAMVPVISGIAAIPLLNEPLTLPVMVGLLFTILGAWMGNKQ